jgi:hypothetical protein
MLVRGWLRSHLLQRHALRGGLLVWPGDRIPSSSLVSLLVELLCWLCIVRMFFYCLPCVPFCYRPCFAAVGLMLVREFVLGVPPAIRGLSPLVAV